MSSNEQLHIKPVFTNQFWPHAVVNYLAVVAITIGSHLAAVNMRLHFTYGLPLGPEYVAQTPLLFLFIIAAPALGFPIVHYGRRFLPFLKDCTPIRFLFLTAIISTLLSALAVLVILPNISQLQIVYYACVSMVISWLTIIVPHKSRRYGTFKQYFQDLHAYRALLFVMVDYNIRVRYTQQILGILWIILLPLSNSLVYAFVFTQFFHRVLPSGIPFVSFYLTALTAWRLFSQSIMTGMTALGGQIGLIQQVYFPREILVLVKLGESFVDFLFVFGAMIVINLAFGLVPTLVWVYLIPITIILLILVLGCMFFLSYLSILIRDVPQLVSVVLQLAFFMTPILYSVDQIPQRYRFFTIINPIAPIIQGYRTVILYHAQPDFTTLYYPAVLACLLVYTGYLFFKMYSRELVDFV